MKLVRFNDGKFGVRSGWLIHSFADLFESNTWWSTPSYVDEYAKGTEAQAREMLAKLKYNSLAHKVVK